MKHFAPYLFCCLCIATTAVIGQFFSSTPVAAQGSSYLMFEQGDLKWSYAATAPEGWIDLTSEVRYKFPDEEWVPSHLRGQLTPDYRDRIPYGAGRYGNVGEPVEQGVLSVPPSTITKDGVPVTNHSVHHLGLVDLDKAPLIPRRPDNYPFLLDAHNNPPKVNISLEIPNADVQGTVRPQGNAAKVFMRCQNCEEVK